MWSIVKACDVQILLWLNRSHSDGCWLSWCAKGPATCIVIDFQGPPDAGSLWTAFDSSNSTPTFVIEKVKKWNDM